MQTLKRIETDLSRRITEDRGQRLFHALYPDRDEQWKAAANKHFTEGSTVYARHKYPKLLEFFRAGAKYRERCLMAANRTGKTLGGGGYETACHGGEYCGKWPALLPLALPSHNGLP